MGGPGMGGPALGGIGAATMALPLSAIIPGGIPDGPRQVPPAPPPPNAGFSPPPNAGFDPRMSQQNVPRTQIGMPIPTGPGAGEQSMHGGMPHTGGGATVLGMAIPPGAMQQSGGWQQAQQPGYGDPGYPPPPGPNGMPTAIPPQKKSKAIPIIIALTVVAILGGVAAIVVVKMGDKSEAAPDASAVASNSASTPEPQKTADPPKSTAGSDTTSGGSAPTPSGTPAPSGSAATEEPELVDVKITCKPECESITVDNKVMENKEGLQLKPGKHKLTITKKGYLPVNETIEVKVPEGFEKNYTLAEAPQQPVIRPPPCRPTFGKPCPR